MKTYIRLFCLLVLMVFSAALNGQLNYKSGYVITLDNDTLKGKINDGGTLKNYKVCLFKSEEGGKAFKYTAKDIKAYHFEGDKSYSAIHLFRDDNFEYVFLENLLEGKLSLYHDRKSTDASYYIKDEIGSLKPLRKLDLKIIEESLTGFGEKKSNEMEVNIFKDTLISVFHDLPEIHSQVRNVNYNQKSLINITKAYINETCEGEDCILYERKLELRKNRFGVFSGIQLSQISFLGYQDVLTESFYGTNAKSDIITSIPFGVFYNIPLELINERLSFQLELLSTSMNYTQTFSNSDNFVDFVEIKSNNLYVPVLLKYEIAGKKLSPSIGVGRTAGFLLNSSIKYDSPETFFIHNTQPKGWIFDAGLDYKINPGLSLFCNFRFQKLETLVVEERYTKVKYSNVIDDYLFNMQYDSNVISMFIGLKF